MPGEGMNEPLLVCFVIWILLSFPAWKRIKRRGFDKESWFLVGYGGMTIGLVVSAMFRLFLL